MSRTYYIQEKNKSFILYCVNDFREVYKRTFRTREEAEYKGQYYIDCNTLIGV